MFFFFNLFKDELARTPDHGKLSTYCRSLLLDQPEFDTRELLAWINHLTAVFRAREQGEENKTGAREAARLLTARNLRRALYASGEVALDSWNNPEESLRGKSLRFTSADFLKILEWRARVLARAKAGEDSTDVYERLRPLLAPEAKAREGVFPATNETEIHTPGEELTQLLDEVGAYLRSMEESLPREYELAPGIILISPRELAPSCVEELKQVISKYHTP